MTARFARMPLKTACGLLLGLFFQGTAIQAAETSKSSPLTPGQMLHWDTTANKVEADLKEASINEVLMHISQATGWEIFLEPGTQRIVTTSFKNSSPSRALDNLLGNLSRVLLPGAPGSAPRFLVFTTNRDNATQRIGGKKISRKKQVKPIENELVVSVKPGTDIKELAEMFGAEIVGSIEELNLYRLKFPDKATADAAREYLNSHEEVASVYDNFPIESDLPSQGVPSSSPLNLRPKAVPDGDRIIIGLIDTVVDPTTPGVSEFLLPTLSVAGESTHPGNQPMHGDSMSQAILRSISMLSDPAEGTAARILPVDVYGGNPLSSTFDVAWGTYQAIEAGAMIINLSLGSQEQSPFLHQIIQSGSQQGVVFFAAAGNEPVATPSFPAAYPEVIAVTAGDPAGNISGFANYGNFIDIVAPGMVRVNYADQSYVVGGTSVSTAFASGMAATMKQDQNLSWTQLESVIRQTYPVNPQALAP